MTLKDIFFEVKIIYTPLNEFITFHKVQDNPKLTTGF